MEIEFMAEFTEGVSRDRARQIIKGKRTKRQRPCSPFATSTTSDNSANNNCLIDNLFDNSTPDQSPAMSSDASKKEDEDMANCLILLAQSVSPVKEKENSDQIRRKTVTTMTTITSAVGAKSGFYVYECKTCNRTFPSFQALGGHRASHKKPKVNVEEKRSGSVSNIHTTPPLIEHVDDEKDNDQQKAVEEVREMEENKASSIIVADNVTKSPSRSTSSVIQTGIVMNVNNTKVKVHECSICGSEFLSGQALGGHMRKHRPIPPTVNRTVISMNTDDMTSDEIVLEKSGSGMLSLDLNFPPPEVVEDHRQSKFQFSTAGSSQERLVFSAPAFVDCRY